MTSLEPKYFNATNNDNSRFVVQEREIKKFLLFHDELSSSGYDDDVKAAHKLP